MRNRTSRIGGVGARIRGHMHWVAALGVAVALTAMPRQDARAAIDEEGPGTEWLACRLKVTGDKYACFRRADGFWDEAFCSLAWNFDLIDCDRRLFKDLGDWGPDKK